MTEQWAFAPGLGTDYEVSDLGRVRSYRRVNRYPNGQVSMLTPHKIGGYWMVHLSGDSKKWYGVHVLMAMAFIRTPEPSEMVRHYDDDPNNNNLSNLVIGTRSDNTLDSVRNGSHHMARKTHCPQGHEYTPENTRIKTSAKQKTNRVCRQCGRDRDKGRNR